MAGGAVALLQPFEQAGASADPRADSHASFVADALGDFEAGAAAKRSADGTLSIDNARFTPQRQAEQERASAAMAAGPSSLTCASSDDGLLCSAIAENKVIPALKRGTVIYGRNAITGVRPGGHVPKVEGDALTCGSAAADGTVRCWPVTEIAPSVLAGSDVVVYYAPFNVSFDASGMRAHTARLTVPVSVG
jgi:hypothetical protein